MKITVLEETSFLGNRLCALLKKHGIGEVDLLKVSRLDHGNHLYLLKDSALLIIDLDHPESDALQLIKRIKENHETKGIQIVTLSQSSDVMLLKQVIAAGCSDFIVKPFDDQVFIERVFKALGKSTLGNQDFVKDLYTLENQENHEHNLKWHKGYEIGVFDIDKEHQDIINHFETLYQLMIEGKGHAYYLNLLSFLGEYVNTHFAHEEAFQQKIKYPNYLEHKGIHDEFKLKVMQMIQENETHNSEEGDRVTNADLIHLNLFIKDWLIHHILIEDKKIGEFIGTK